MNNFTTVQELSRPPENTQGQQNLSLALRDVWQLWPRLFYCTWCLVWFNEISVLWLKAVQFSWIWNNWTWFLISLRTWTWIFLLTNQLVV